VSRSDRNRLLVRPRACRTTEVYKICRLTLRSRTRNRCRPANHPSMQACSLRSTRIPTQPLILRAGGPRLCCSSWDMFSDKWITSSRITWWCVVGTVTLLQLTSQSLGRKEITRRLNGEGWFDTQHCFIWSNWTIYTEIWSRLGIFIYTGTIYAFILLSRIYRRSRDSAVGIATGYELDDRGVAVRVPVRIRIFFSPRHLDRLWGPPCLLSNGYLGFFLRE
jgi:hypothetical protein